MNSHAAPPPLPSQRGRVVLCCADENLLELAPVVEGLGKLSLSVELVSGVDLDSTLVNAAVGRLGADNRWVLCQSDALDAFQIGRLEQNLLESGVSSVQVMTCDVDSTSPTQLIDSISHAAPGHDTAASAAASETPSITGTSPAAGTGPSPTIGALLGSDLPPAMPDDELDPPTRNLMPLFVGAGGVALLAIVVAVIVFNRQPASESETEVASASMAAREADGVAPKTKVETTNDAAALPESESDEAATGGLEANADTDGEPLADGETDGMADDELAMLDEGEMAEEGQEPSGDEAPEAAVVEEQALIDAAIRSREIRSLDILLVHPQRSRRRSYDKAKTWCEDKEIAGIGKWRLPTIGEVRTISDARLVPRDYYWTHTAADTFGDQLLVWNGKRKRITPKKSRWSGGRAVCVRTRDGAPAISEDQSASKDAD